MSHRCRILMTGRVTHDVMRFVLERPSGFEFAPGMASEMAIDREGWREERRPFTFTSLPADEVLELTVKGYPEHGGVTQALHGLRPGDTLLVGEPFGTIRYRGPGIFVAGGAGITPFLSILRAQEREGTLGECHLVFANKTLADVIEERELRHLLGDRAVFLLDDLSGAGLGYVEGRVTGELLATWYPDTAERRFYLCGPPPMVRALRSALQDLGADPEALVFEA